MDDSSLLQKPIKVQPNKHVSFLSKIFFCWALPIFYRNHRKTPSEKYYIPLKSHKSELLGDKIEKAWNQEYLTNSDPNLWLIIWKIFRVEFIAFGLLFIFSEFVLKMSQPWLIGKLMKQYASKSVGNSKDNCYFYGLFIILTSFASVILTHFYQLKIQHLGMKIRVGCCSLIYRKVLKINKNVLVDSNVGNVINLLSNDVNRLDLAAMHLLQLVVAPIETIFIIYFLYTTVGPTSITGIVLLMLFIPVQMYMGKLTTACRRKTAIKTDQRIKLMDEILNGIQAIKMFTWEELFTEMISKARKFEVRQILKVSLIRAFNISSMLFLNRTGIFLSVLTYALTHNEINAEYVFVVSSFYAMLRQTLTVYFPSGIQNFSESRVSIRRIKTFLMAGQTKKETTDYIFTKNKVQIIKSNSDKNTSGKSEGQPAEVHFDSVSVKWLQSSPRYILDNVNLKTGGNELVLITGPVGSGKTTLLLTILQELPVIQGQLTVTGTVSYASQEPWLFSGTIRQNILFGSSFDAEKYSRIVEICQLENDFLALTDGDATSVGESGSLLSGGQKTRINLARVLYKDADIYLLDDPLAAVDYQVAKKIFEECILGYLKDKCRVLVTHHSSSLIGAANKIYLLQNGVLSSDVNHQKTELVQNEEVSNESSFVTVIKNKQSRSENEGKKSKLRSREVYQKYVQSSGGYITFILLCLLFVLTQAAASGADYFVAYWTNLKNQDDNICIIIYASIIVGVVVLSLTRSMIFFYYCLKASTNLHNQMFSRIIKAPMAFFKITATGKILNRFSKDVGSVDETLPSLFMDTFQVTLIILGSTLLVTFVNPWMLIPTIAIFALFYLFKTRYLGKSRKIKRLEAEARSPIYSHMQATIQGLTTIKTFKVQTILKSEFDHNQDLHSSAFYTFMTFNRAFGFWLDMICVFYTTVVIITIMLMDTSAGNIGLSITQSINLIGVLQWGIRQWSELQNQMINVERVVEYTKIDQEKDSSDEEPPQDWPSKGEVRFESVSLKYSDRLALDNVSFEIKPGEKIGIVGRTGAGKSSLTSTLFRLYDTEGNILIDGVNIMRLPLNILRSKITIIPQDPVLFTGTLRDNIDPYHEFPDDKLWTVLEDMELKTTIMSLPQNLYTKILQGGSNFSAGEKQIICLARAVLRNNKIVIMDEATANVDAETDVLIQEKFKKSFRDATVVTIAHRLNTVMHSDRILVVDDGKVVEFDSPDRLMHNSQSVFAQFVKENEKMLSIPEINEDD